MLDPNLIAAIKQNYQTFFDAVAKIDERYIRSQANFDALRRWCRAEGITDEMLGEAGGDRIFNSAYVSCRAANTLELAPTTEEKTAQETVQRQHANADKERRDREDGNPRNPLNRYAQNPAKNLRQQMDEDHAERKRRVEFKVQRMNEAAKKEKAEHDFSALPTINEIVNGGAQEMPTTWQKSLSRYQLREYLRRFNDAQRTLQAERRKAARQQKEVTDEND